MTWGQGLKWFAGHTFSPSGCFLGFFLPPPPLEWTSFPPLVTAVLITPNGAEPPGTGCIGVIGALVYFLPLETVLDKLYSP